MDNYPIYMYLVRSSYDWGMGKVLLIVAQLLHFFPKPVVVEEKRGHKPGFVGRQMPNGLAVLALHQFKKLGTFMAHRKMIAGMYARAGIAGTGTLRYAVITPHAHSLSADVKREKIYLGDWYDTAIAPHGVSYEAIGYVPSDCPVAERLANQAVNLPTNVHITEQDAQRIIQCIHSFNP